MTDRETGAAASPSAFAASSHRRKMSGVRLGHLGADFICSWHADEDLMCEQHSGCLLAGGHTPPLGARSSDQSPDCVTAGIQRLVRTVALAHGLAGRR